MQKPKRVLCVMDISGVGRCSLGVVLPVLAACGVQACPLPTALFSAHTGGFGAPAVHDEAEFCAEALQHYTAQGIEFDAVYTGYLRTEGQFDVAEAALKGYPDAYKIVDPAIADNCELYASITPQLAERMRKLADMADLITPNYTEAAMLLGAQPAKQALPHQQMAARMAALAQRRSVVLTSVPTQQGGMEVWGCGQGAGTQGDAFVLPVTMVPQSYPGTGDLFAAAVAGLVLRGLALREAAAQAAAFVQAAAQATYAGGGKPRHGVWFEAALPMLARAVRFEVG